MNEAGQTIFWTVWCSTLIILCDAIRLRRERASLLDNVTSGWRSFGTLLLTGTLSGVLLDGPAQWLGKLWIYPYWTPAVYGATFVLGFSAYWLLLAETYLLVRCGLRRFFPAAAATGPLHHSGYWGAGGVGLLVAGLALAFRRYGAGGGYRFDVNGPSAVHAPFASFLLLTVGIWLLLEAAAARRGRVSLLAVLRAGHVLPLAAILAAGWACGFLMETANAAHRFWVYTHWPWERATLCGVPAAVLAAWPLQYVVFLSVFRLFSGEEIWG